MTTGRSTEHDMPPATEGGEAVKPKLSTAKCKLAVSPKSSTAVPRPAMVALMFLLKCVTMTSAAPIAERIDGRLKATASRIFTPRTAYCDSIDLKSAAGVALLA